MFPQKGTKQQKLATSKDKKVAPTDDSEETTTLEGRQQRIWAPWLEVKGVAISLNASIRELQRGHSAYIAEALEQPLLLPKDMDTL